MVVDGLEIPTPWTDWCLQLIEGGAEELRMDLATLQLLRTECWLVHGEAFVLNDGAGSPIAFAGVPIVVEDIT